jgi:hypothetical protein
MGKNAFSRVHLKCHKGCQSFEKRASTQELFIKVDNPLVKNAFDHLIIPLIKKLLRNEKKVMETLVT